jgi:hypothetical protein
MKIEIDQINFNAAAGKPSPYWLAIYGPKHNLPASGNDVIDGDSIDPTDQPFMTFNHKPSQQDLKDSLGEGEILLVVLKVTP